MCSDGERLRYARRVSGPLLDRFDLRVPVARPGAHDLLDGTPGESTASVAARVRRARALSIERQGTLNAVLGARRLDEHAQVDEAAKNGSDKKAQGVGRIRQGLWRERERERLI